MNKRCEIINKRHLYRVLIVDDDPVFQTMISAYLERSGYCCTCCNSAEAALIELIESPFRILLCDWNLPGMSGLSFIEQIRKQEQDYHYIMMMTGNHADHEVIAGFNAGADDYLVKGARKLEFIARLDAGLRVIVQQSELVRQKQEIEQQSLLDPLTQSYNRRHLMEHGKRELKRAQRYGHNLSLIMCDLDHFKDINDQYGHLMGDQVLVQVSSAMSAILRNDIDWIARFGGEEFVVVLPNTNSTEASLVAEKLRLAIADMVVSYDQQSVSVSASFGICSSMENENLHMTFEALISLADQRLYHSKRLGRNRCTIMTD